MRRFLRKQLVDHPLYVQKVGACLCGVFLGPPSQFEPFSYRDTITVVSNGRFFHTFSKNGHFWTKRAKTKRLHRVAQIEDDRGKEIFTIAERAKK